jgi:hypothetical protein
MHGSRMLPVDIEAPVEPAGPTPRPDRRRYLRIALSVLAIAFVWLALVAPDRLNHVGFGTFARVPVEGVVLAAAALVLPLRWRRVGAVLLGVVVAVLLLLKVVDTGFFDEVDRPFNLVDDWGNFGPAVGVLRDSVGSFWSHAAVVAALAAGVAVLVLVPLALVHLAGAVDRRRGPIARVVAVLAVVWVAGAAFGAPLASSATAALGVREVRDVHNTIESDSRFSNSLTAPDPYAAMPAGQLMSRLHGKDVLLVFVESYGRVAVQDTWFAPPTDELLRSDSAQLRAAGYTARSAFLKSPTFGGISWLAHSTLQSGLWVDTTGRYGELIDSSRFTLSAAFHKAGWRTVSDVPSDVNPWPEGKRFYGYDQLYDAHNVGYRGPKFSYERVPDQYTLAQFQRNELQPGHAPVMAEIDLVSSHTPWAPLPRMVPWSAVGDGSVYDPMPKQGASPTTVWKSSHAVQGSYAQSIRYSITAMVSWIERLHDPNLVVVMLGDHQPATIVSGDNPGHDVPISIIAADPSVFAPIASWNWQDGLLPDPSAPVWHMDQFRDRFFDAYSRS